MINLTLLRKSCRDKKYLFGRGVGMNMLKCGRGIRILACVFVMGCIFAFSSITADATEIVDSGSCGNDAIWTFDDEGILTISGQGDMSDYGSGSDTAPWRKYINQTKDIVIEKGITSIGDNAFRLYGVKYITIPEGVKRIGKSAFDGSFVFSIELPCSIKDIDDKAFSDCSKLYEIELPNGLENIGSDAFYECENLRGTLVIPSSVLNIGERAFCNCTNLEGVKLPNRISKIARDLFDGCKTLTEMTIPDGVEKIESGAFHGCSQLTKITIPASVVDISSNAFIGCNDLAIYGETGSNAYVFACDNNIPFYGVLGNEFNWSIDSNGVLTVGIDGDMPNFSTEQYEQPWQSRASEIKKVIIMPGTTSVGDNAFENCENIASVTMPDGITRIGDRAFYHCTSLEGDLPIPNSVTDIGHEAFLGCKKLTGKLRIPDNVTHIGRGAFQACENLTGDLIIPAGVREINGDVFSGCKSLTGNLIIPDGVTRIGMCAFSDCVGLTGNLTIPNSVVKIGDFAFKDCKGFNGKLTLSSQLTTIGCCAFENCTKLKGNIIIPGSVVSIEECAFELCSSLESVKLSEGINTIEPGAFNGCVNLKSVEIPNTVTQIGEQAFGYCTSLTGELKIPSGVTKIEKSTFVHCENLESIAIPEGVTSIREDAFNGCNSLKSIELPESLINLDVSALFMCSNLAEINVNSKNTAYSSIDAVLYNKDESTLIFVPERYAQSSLLIPNSVKKIAKDSFSGQETIKEITILENVMTIEGQSVLEHITIKGYRGTAAENYSYENGNQFIEISQTPENPEKPSTDAPIVHEYFKSGNKTFDGEYGYYYSDAYFSNPSTTYNQHLATMSLCMAFSTYGEGGYSSYDKNVRKVMDDCGFCAGSRYEQYSFNTEPGYDSIGCAIGSKSINDDTSLIVVAIRSGGYEKEWASNVTMGLVLDHKGFDDASQLVYSHIKNYISQHDSELKGNIKIWITGFSRGAATATQTAAKLNNLVVTNHKIGKENIYAYGFATPAGAVKESNPHSSKFNNIFNVIEYNDIVPLLAPAKLGFDRYGSTRILPYHMGSYSSFAYIQNVKKRLKEMGYSYKVDSFDYSKLDLAGSLIYVPANIKSLGLFNHSLVDTVADTIRSRDNYVKNYEATVRKTVADGKEYAVPLIPWAASVVSYNAMLTATAIKNYDILACTHAGQQYYIAWMQLMDSNYPNSMELKWGDSNYKCVNVNCPVDIDVYDSDNILVASIRDEVPLLIEGSNIISMIDENGQKQIYLPSDESFTTTIVAREDCDVTMSIEEIDADEGTVYKDTLYDSVNMDENETVALTVPELNDNELYDEENESSSTIYSANIGDEILTPTISIEGKDKVRDNSFDIEVKAENSGKVYGGGTFIVGEYCQLIAEPYEGEAFIGWYEGDKLLSENPTERLLVRNDMSIEGKFTHNAHIWNAEFTVDKEANCTEEGRRTYTCTICGETKNEVIDAGHNYTHVKVVAGYLKNGKEYDKCTRCANVINSKILPGYSASYVKAFKVSKSNKALNVKWKKQSAKNQKLFTGYQIRYSTSSSMTGAKYVSAKKSAKSKKLSKLKAKTTYYVQMRSYKTVGGVKYYSSWTSKKATKTK